MKKLMDYEKKVCGGKEESSWAIFNPQGLEPFPKDFLRNVKGKILDVGCGAGGFTGLLKKIRPDLDIYGVDISKNAIKIAKKDFPKVKFSVGTSYKLPFRDNFFDAAIMRQILEHVEYPEKALKELKRVLKPKAIFYSATPIEGEKFVINPPKYLCIKYQGHIQRFSIKSLKYLIEKNGFEINNYYFYGFLLCQIINVVCLSAYNLMKFPNEFSVKGYVEEGRTTTLKRILGSIRKIIFALENIEAKLVPRWIPGRSMHIVARKL